MKMKIQKFNVSAIIMMVVMLAGIGIAMADEEKMTDHQYCAKEAKEAGMSEEKDVSEYITQCLAEMEETKSAKPPAESGS
jgi:hypothetical protein